ncbi:MAG: helix-hairpin-helix domain-containing protein [Gammaproteobacteria bacterium]|jgi:competence protein ComEA|nr:MAG: helix-hairpin-helix domain-containing protein [Gammaproteobacteria bacterium]
MERLMLRAMALGAMLFTGLVNAGTVNINTADAETLASELEGVGAARAEAIVEYRQRVGRFDTAEQLLDVTGVGPRVLEWNADRIVVSSGGDSD